MRKNIRRIICLGDSLTLGIPFAELDRWPTQLATVLERKWPGQFSVYNRGTNGSTAHDALNRMEGEIGWLFPAFVLVAYGVNEANMPRWRRTAGIGVEEFKSDLREIYRYVTTKGGRTGLIAEHAPGPDRRPEPQRAYVPGNGKTYRENYWPYHEAVLETARELKAPVTDIPARMEAGGLTITDITSDDGLHLSLAGNELYARSVLDMLEPILFSLPLDA